MNRIIKVFAFVLFFLLISCEKDLYEESIYKSNEVTIEKISLNELMSQVENPIIKNYLGTLRNTMSSNLGNKLSDEELLYFQKFVKESEYTSYSIRLNDFTTEKPYFLEFVIKIDGDEEKAGFIKYTPEEATPVFDARSFTGQVEVTNLNNHVVASNQVINSIPVNTTNSFASSECFSTIELVQNNCTHGGNHAPGESCSGPGGNNGYYEIIITNFCLTFPEDLNFIAAPDSSIGNYGGSGFVPLTPEEIAFNNFLNILTDEQSNVLATNPKLIEYLRDHGASNQSRDFILQLINIIIQNDLELDFSPQTSINPDINNLDELNDFVESINFDTEDNTVGETNSINQDQFFATKTIQLSPIINLAIEVVANTQPSFSLESSGCTSYISNVVVGNSWVQNSMSVTKMNFNSTDAQITLVGYNNVGISFQGLEFGIKQRRKITFLIDKTTGEICCFVITKID